MGTLKAKVAGNWETVTGSGKAAADLAHWNSAWGRVASASTSTPQNGIGSAATDLTGLTVTFVPVAGRYYRASFEGRFFATGAGVIDLYITDGAGNVLTNANGDNKSTAGWVPFPSLSTPPLTLSGTSYTIKVQASINTSALNTSPAGDRPLRLVVEDIGPIAPAAISPPQGSPMVTTAGNALGIIAMGSFVPPLAPHTISLNVVTALTYPLRFFAAVGRRYRIHFQIRATSNTAGVGTQSFYLRDNGTEVRGWSLGGDPYLWLAGAYAAAVFDWMLDGDGAAHSVEVLCTGVGANMYLDYGLWTVEDVGPNSSPPAYPIVQNQAWITATGIQANWSHFNNDPLYLMQYRKIGDQVELRGLAGRINSAVTGSENIFFLPAGFYCTQRRPLFYCQRQDGLQGRILIDQTNGAVVGTFGQTAYPNMAAGAWISLDGCSFSTTG